MQGMKLLITAALTALAGVAQATPVYTPTTTGGTWTYGAGDFDLAMPGIEQDGDVLKLDTGDEWYPGCALKTTPVVIPHRDGFEAFVTVEIKLKKADWEGFVNGVDGINPKMLTAELDDGGNTWEPRSVRLYAIDPHPRQEYSTADGRIYLVATAANRTLPLAGLTLTERAPSFTVGLCELRPNIQLGIQRATVTISYRRVEG